MSWSWQYLDADGSLSPVGDTAAGEVIPHPPEAATRSDAESWLGEHWRALAAAGVVLATLIDGERIVDTLPLTEL